MVVDGRCRPNLRVNLLYWSYIYSLPQWGCVSLDHAHVSQAESLGSLRGTPILHRSLQRSWLPLVSDQWVGLRVGSCLLFHLAREDTDLLSLGQIHVGHDVPVCRCKHEFSDSNALTASTNVIPEELHWPPCTYWRLGWCRMLQVPVLLQHYGCYPVGVGRYLMLCHTQYIRNLAWIGQWPCTASGECLCPAPLQVCDHSDKVEGLLVLRLQCPDVLLEGEVRIAPKPEELCWLLHW